MRIEHRSAADGRSRAEDDAVAARGDDGSREPQLREAVADARDAREYIRRPVMHVDTGWNLRERLEDDVEPVARPVRARRDERVTAPHVGAFHARKRKGDPLAGLRALDRAVVHLHAANADVPPARFDAQLVAFADRAGPQRSRHDRSDPTQCERAVDVQPCRRLVATALGRDRGERGAKLVEAAARSSAHGDDRGAGDELLRFRARELERLLVREVGLRQRDDTALDAE